MKSKQHYHSSRRYALPIICILAFVHLTSVATGVQTYTSSLNYGTSIALAQDLDLSTLDDDATSDVPSAPEQSDLANDAPAQTTALTPERARLLDLVLASGWIGILLLLCSIVAVSIIIRISLSLRRSKFIPEQLARQLQEAVAHDSYSQAALAASNDDSFFARVALAGIKEADRGWNAVEKSLEDASAEQTAALYRRTEPLSTIGNVAPMLGLLGTVVGMVTTFGELAVADAGGRNLANGIYFALVTTVDGLIVAIPTLVVHSLLNAKIASLVSEALEKLNKIFEPAKRRLASPNASSPSVSITPLRGLREVTSPDIKPQKPQQESLGTSQETPARPAPQPTQRPSLSLKNRQ